MRLQSCRFIWTPIEHPKLSRPQQDYLGVVVQSLLEKWEGTPYMEGQRLRGVAVDCVNFFAAVYDDLCGFTESPAPVLKLRGDRALHDRTSTMKVMRTLIQAYAPNCRIDDGSIEPGDVAVTGPIGGGPGHVLIASNETNSFFHATTDRGIVRAGATYFDGIQQPFKIYRYQNKLRWL